MTLDIAHATPDDFSSFVGQDFLVHCADSPISLTLDNVKRFTGSMVRDSRVVVGGVELPPRAAFALTFEGPRDPIIPSGTYQISHPQAGDLTLFLSPFRQDMDCMLYECVFN